jgi:RHS repeat-associated protein
MTRPNNVTTNYSYDNLSRLLSVLHQAGGTIDGAVYTVDAAGNRTSKADQLAGVTTDLPGSTSRRPGSPVIYGYDQIYQLLSATQGGNTTESYTYDPVGNRLSSLGVSPYTYNPSNEMVSTPTAMYVYDSDGNLTSKTDSNGTTSYTWDYENRLTLVTLPGSGGSVTFKYDPFGRRVYKSSSAGTSIFAYDGDNLIEEVNASGAVVARYTQGQNIDEPLAMYRSGATSYYEQDGLGSVTSLTNGAGALAQTYTFDSFGKTTNATGSLTNPFQYTAREFDSETGLYYYRARYYDPNAGRLISEDPIAFDGDINFYRYVRNSPVAFNDPTGRCPDPKRFQKCVDDAISKILLREELINVLDLVPIFPTSTRGLGYAIAGLGNGISALGAEYVIASPTKAGGVLLGILGQEVAVPGYVLIKIGTEERIEREDQDMRLAIAQCQKKFLGK